MDWETILENLEAAGAQAGSNALHTISQQAAGQAAAQQTNWAPIIIGGLVLLWLSKR